MLSFSNIRYLKDETLPCRKCLETIRWARSAYYYSNFQTILNLIFICLSTPPRQKGFDRQIIKEWGEYAYQHQK
jgi:hypothetical protein